MRGVHRNEKQDAMIQQAESGMTIFFWAIFAILFCVWLCHDTSAGLTDSIHRKAPEVNVLKYLGLIS